MACTYPPGLISLGGSNFPLMQHGSSGTFVAYLQECIQCHQGFDLGWEYDNAYYWQATANNVAAFQAWWSAQGANIGPVDGKAGPMTMPFYRMMVGHTPWH